MVNIDKDKFSVFDMEDYIKENTNNFQMTRPLQVVNVHSTEFNNGTGRDYEFCHDIFHPETGEKLKPVRGYVGHDQFGNDMCFYAEFQDNKGQTYSYTYQFAKYDLETGRKILDTKSIKAKMVEDLKILQDKLNKEAEAKKKKEEQSSQNKNDELDFEGAFEL